MFGDPVDKFNSTYLIDDGVHMVIGYKTEDLDLLYVDFYKSIFKDYSYYIGTTPLNLNLIDQFNKSGGKFIDDLTGFELIVIVKK
jgi:hypothetical protein